MEVASLIIDVEVTLIFQDIDMDINSHSMDIFSRMDNH